MATLVEALQALPDSSEARRRLEALRARLATERNLVAASHAAVEQLGREANARNARLAAIAGERQEWRERKARATGRLGDLEQRRSVLEATLSRLAEEPARLVVPGFRDLEKIEGADYAFAGIPDPLEEGFCILMIAQKGCRCLETAARMNGAKR